MAKKTRPTTKVRARVAEKQGVNQELDLRFLPGDAADVLGLLNLGSFNIQGKMTERFSVLKAKLATLANSKTGPAPVPEKPKLVETEEGRESE